MEEVGSGISDMLDIVLDKLENAGKHAGEYGRTLSEASGGLGGDQSPAGLRKMVDGLVGATRAMEERTKTLEGELQRSSEQVSELKTQLDDVRKESRIDPLTGIANRKAFDTELQAAIEDAAETGAALALLDVRHRPFQDLQRHLGPSDRRSGAAPGGQLPVGERQGPRHRRALRRRGIRRHPAPDRPRRRGQPRQPDPLDRAKARSWSRNRPATSWAGSRSRSASPNSRHDDQPRRWCSGPTFASTAPSTPAATAWSAKTNLPSQAEVDAA